LIPALQLQGESESPAGRRGKQNQGEAWNDRTHGFGLSRLWRSLNSPKDDRAEIAALIHPNVKQDGRDLID
jgi:hypothetical protein